jgi:hypothetical protein
MQHIETPALHFEGHSTVWRIVKYLSFALAGLIAVFEHSSGLLIVLTIGFVMVLAATEQTRELENELPVNPRASASRLLGDGGSFPAAVSEKEHQESGASHMLDGGSL